MNILPVFNLKNFFITLLKDLLIFSLVIEIHVMNGSDSYTNDIALNFLLNLIFRIPDKSIQQGITHTNG